MSRGGKRRRNDQASIRQLDDGRWHARFTLAPGKAGELYGKTEGEVRDAMHHAIAIDAARQARKVSGVYVIFDTVTYATYIGESRDVHFRRKTHRSELAAGRHPYQAELGAAYAAGTLRFKVLERLSQDVSKMGRLVAEARWMEHFEPFVVNRRMLYNGEVVQLRARHAAGLPEQATPLVAPPPPVMVRRPPPPPRRRRSATERPPPQPLPADSLRETMRQAMQQEIDRLRAQVQALMTANASLAETLAKVVGSDPADLVLPIDVAAD